MSTIHDQRPPVNGTGHEATHDVDDTLTDPPTQCFTHGEWEPCSACAARDREYEEWAARRRIEASWPDGDFEYLAPELPAAYEPTAEEWAEAEAVHEEMVAERLLNRRGLPLADLVELQAAFYRSWNSPTGELIAGRLEELAGEIRATKSECVSDFEARDQLLVQWKGEDS